MTDARIAELMADAFPRTKCSTAYLKFARLVESDVRCDLGLPLAHSPERAAKRLGVSTRSVYTLIANDELRSFKVGKRRLIPESECQAFIARQLAARR